MMKKIGSALLAAALLLGALFAAGCAVPETDEPDTSAPNPPETAGRPVKTGEIPPQRKGYFGDHDSSLTIALGDYVEENGAPVTYTAESSDPETVTVSLAGDLLTVTVLSGDASADVTVCVFSGDEPLFDFSFPVAGVRYKKVVCVGDSLTYGHTWPNEAYPIYLNKELHDDGIRVAGFGSNGATVLADLHNDVVGPYSEREAYEKSMRYNPDVVFILLGTNDTHDWDAVKDDFASAYRAFIETYRTAFPEALILLGTAPATAPDGFISNEYIGETVVPVQREVAREMGLPLIDFYAMMNGREDGCEGWFREGDGVHFSVEGAQEIARIIAEEIRKH